MAVSRDQPQAARHRSEHGQVPASRQRWRLFPPVSQGRGGVWGLKERARGPGHGTPRSRQGGACESGGKAELEAQSSPAEGSGDVL